MPETEEKRKREKEKKRKRTYNIVVKVTYIDDKKTILDQIKSDQI